MGNLFIHLSILVLFCSLNNCAECARLPRMIGANSTEPNEFKYVVFIEAIDLPGSKHKRCTGGILDDYHILTAAHCVIAKDTNDFKPSRFKVTAGTHDLNSTLPKIERFVEKIMLPKVYNGSYRLPSLDLKEVLGDIAVLKLDEPLDLLNSDKLDNLELPEVGENNLYDDSQLEGQTLKLAGYGWNYIEKVWREKDNMLYMDGVAGYSDGKLMKADVLIYNHEKCDEESIRRVSQAYICAKMTKQYMSQWRGICHGDSGGPLVFKDKIVVGVAVAGSRECNENMAASQYMRVTFYRKFIDDAMSDVTDDIRSKNADDNGYF